MKEDQGFQSHDAGSVAGRIIKQIMLIKGPLMAIENIVAV